MPTQRADHPSVGATPCRRKYNVVLTFRGGWWAVEVPELPGVVTHTSDPHRADAIIREAIGFALDADPATFEVELNMVPRADRETFVAAS